MSAWTYIAQRAVTKEWLHWDLPLETEGPNWELSGPGSLNATVAPDVGGLRAPDGRLVLEEWGTLVYAISGGLVRWGGVVVLSSFEGSSWTVEATGFGAYPHGRIFDGEISSLNIDPADAFRAVWSSIQAAPDGDLGVTVTGATSTGVRLGADAVAEYVPPNIIAARAIKERMDDPELSIGEDWTWPGNPQEVRDWNDPLQDAYLATGGAWDNRGQVSVWLETYMEDRADSVISAKDAEPYELVWWEAPNAGEELDTLAKVAPFDWVERHAFSPDGDDIVHEVELAHPRAGTLREDLVFVQGENVSSVVSIESNGDEFANAVVGLGAGEGRAMLRRETGIRDGRLRREATYSDKSITDSARMDALIADELSARRAALRITSFDVIDHPNAPLGSWQLGDDVLLRAHVPWLGAIEMRVRITGWSLKGDGKASLRVQRSDLFSYGGTTE